MRGRSRLGPFGHPEFVRAPPSRTAMLPPPEAGLNHFRGTPQLLHISSRRRMRSASGGCVENSRSSLEVSSPGIREGWESHRCAVALFAERIAVGLSEIFARAE